jgi:type VI secretion system protein ImpH
MGAEGGEPDLAITYADDDGGLTLEDLPERLRRKPGDFEFFQAVRLLQQLAGAENPIGSFDRPSEEPVRIGVRAALSFPPSEIQSLAASRDPGGPLKMTVNFFGLTGPSGVLPTRYTELLVERMYAHDATLKDFLDIFNHRLVSLLYRAWEKYRFPVAYERGGKDSFTGYLLDLIGLGTAGLQNRTAVPDQALICYEGLLAQYPRSEQAFRQMLSDYFEVPVEVQPFAGSWRPLDAGSRTCFLEGRSQSEQLGVGIVLGDEVWDQQSVVRVRLGPMTLAQYRDFLPGGSAHEPLKTLARFFCGDDLDVEAQLILKREEAPRFSLGAEGVAPPALGWVSWMFSKPLGRDPDETVMYLWKE